MSFKGLEQYYRQIYRIYSKFIKNLGSYSIEIDVEEKN